MKNVVTSKAPAGTYTRPAAAEHGNRRNGNGNKSSY